MWVKLLTVYSQELNGTTRHKQPGDWIEVGKQQALRMVADRVAEIPLQSVETRTMLVGCGVIVTRPELLDEFKDRASPLGVGISISEAMDVSLYDRTLLATESCNINQGYIGLGLNLLDRWEVACPLMNYTTLATNMGTEQDRELTKKVIRDLRVPVYDSRCIFLRKCESSNRLVETWKHEIRQGSGEMDLALLRAIYTVKPLLLALPVTWLNKNYDTTLAD